MQESVCYTHNTHTHKRTHTHTPVHVHLCTLQAFHGDKELFNSDHEDIVHKNTIIGKCNVHSLRSYENLRQIGDNDFFARFSYKVYLKTVDSVRVCENW